MKLLVLVAGVIAACLFGAEVSKPLRLQLRSRVEAVKGINQWKEVAFERSLKAEQTTIVICDMWDKHWCRGATERVNKLVVKINPVLEAARRRG
ncbi:MAG: hypothetical protein WKF37_04275 [Bryobacteraceae bacterium]